MGSKQPAQSSNMSLNMPNPAVLGAENNVLSTAQQVAATPYQAYGGEQVAGINSQQNTGIAGVNAAANSAAPSISDALNLTASGSGAANAQAFSPQALGQYMSPYQQQVVDATMAQIGNQNTQQQQQLKGNVISSGAFGGDRAGVASAELANQQGLAANATLANLNNQNYTQGLGEFNNQQQTQLAAQQANLARQLQGGAQTAQIGTAGQTAALQGAGAQIGAGTLQQTTQQAQDTAAYNQFLQQQAYPFQTTGWLANIVNGVAPNMGSTSMSQGTQQSASTGGLGSILGGGLALAGALLARGGVVGDEKRSSHAAGGAPYIPSANDPTFQSWVPASTGGGGSVQYPKAQQFGGNGGSTASGAAGLGGILGNSGFQSGLKSLDNAFQNSSLGDTFNDAIQDIGDNFAFGGVVPRSYRAQGGNVNPFQGIPNSYQDRMLDSQFARGGIVPRHHYDDGGDVSPYGSLVGPDDSAAGPIASMAVDPNFAFAPNAPVAPVASMAANPQFASLADAPTPATPVSYGVIPANSVAIAKDATGAPVPTDSEGNALNPDGSKTSSGLGEARIAPTSPMSPAVTDAVAAVDRAAAPRSIRNNNPGNIEDGDFAKGLPGYVGGDGRFARFDTTENGVNAQDRLLKSYGDRGFNTVASIVGRWSPIGDNGADNTNAYIKAVSNAVGVDPNTPLNMDDPNVRSAVRTAMAAHEAGTGGGDSSGPALAYSSDNGPKPSGGGLGSLGTRVAQLFNPNSATDAPDASATSGDDKSSDNGGGLGHFLNLSPEAKQGLIAAGLGIMAAKTNHIGQAIGEGGLAGVKTYQEALDRGLKSKQLGLSAANINSEIENRKVMQSQGQQSIDNQAKNLSRQLDQTASSIKNDTARVGISQAEQNLKETVAQRGIDAAKAAAAALTNQNAPANGPHAPNAPTAPVAPGTPVGAASGVPVNSSGFASSSQESDPDALEARAARFDLAATAAAQDPTIQKSMMDRGNQLREAAAKIRGNYFDLNKPVLESTEKQKDGAIQVKNNALAFRNTLFDDNGNPRTITGPTTDFVNKLASVAEAYGVNPSTIKSLANVDPSKAEDLKKIATNMVGEMARDSMGPGQRIAVAEYQNQMKGTPNTEILPRTAKFIIDNLIVPRADWEIQRFGTIVNQDPRGSNLRGVLNNYDTSNPLDKIISGKINTSNAAEAAARTAPPPPAGAPAGTRQAPDGKFYAPDPSRPGKYLMVH